MKRAIMIQTRLVCPKCGNIQIIFRKIVRRKKYGHIKDLWCFKCKEVTKHIEICNEEIEEAKDEQDRKTNT